MLLHRLAVYNGQGQKLWPRPIVRSNACPSHAVRCKLGALFYIHRMNQHELTWWRCRTHSPWVLAFIITHHQHQHHHHYTVTIGGATPQFLDASNPSLHLLSPSLPFTFPSLPFPSPFLLPPRSRPPDVQLGDMGSVVSSASGAPAEKLTSGGIKFTSFPENWRTYSSVIGGPNALWPTL